MNFYIYQEELDGNDFKICAIAADSKEDAQEKYFKQENISEDDKHLYYAVDKDRVDREEEILKEVGYSSWDEYNKDLHPDRPMEL